MNGPIKIAFRLVDGLHFRTSREIYWNLPNDGGEWRVPVATMGTVKVNPKTNEVGFVFVGLTHPLYGVGPTIAKPGSPIPTWMNPVDMSKGKNHEALEL